MAKQSAIAQALRLIADAIELEAQATPAPSGDADTPVPIARLIELFVGTGEGFWRAAITNGDLPGYRLSRQRLAAKPSDAKAFIQANPLKLRPPKKAGEPELSGLDAALASGQLVSRRAGAK